MAMRCGKAKISAPPFDDWVTVWKSGATRILKRPEWRWQAGSFHHRIRSYEDYNEKLNYMQENPVKAGLVERMEDWPYRGECFSVTIGGLESMSGQNDAIDTTRSRAKPPPTPRLKSGADERY
jgi:hypothetical protein